MAIVNGFCQVTPITMHHVFERLLTTLYPPRFGRLGSNFSLSVPSSYTQCSGPARPHHTSLDGNSKMQSFLGLAAQCIAASQLVDLMYDHGWRTNQSARGVEPWHPAKWRTGRSARTTTSDQQIECLGSCVDRKVCAVFCMQFIGRIKVNNRSLQARITVRLHQTGISILAETSTTLWRHQPIVSPGDQRTTSRLFPR